MERDLPWVADLQAQERAWIGMIVQAGVTAFVDWYRHPSPGAPLRAEVFGAAPRAMAGVVSLRQTVELIRLSLEVVEEHVPEVVGETDAPAVRAAIATYAREVAFATAEVYARAAEQRGAWDARLEALVVDALLRGDPDQSISSRAGALGWRGRGHVVVMIGRLDDASTLEQVRHTAAERDLDVLCSPQGDHLVVVLGGVDALGRPAAQVADCLAPGPVVVGPVVSGLLDAPTSARAAESGHRAVRGWPQAPRPVRADDLWPERSLDGDLEARAALVALVRDLPEDLRATLEYYLAEGGSIEATGRALFVHPNTVRYRLRRISELTGRTPTDARDAHTLALALTLDRLDYQPVTDEPPA